MKQEQCFVHNPAMEQIVRAFLLGRLHAPEPLKDVPLYMRPLETCFVGNWHCEFGATPAPDQVTACAYYGVRAQSILNRLLAMKTRDTSEPVCFLTSHDTITASIGAEVGAVYAAVNHLLFKKGKRKVRAH